MSIPVSPPKARWISPPWFYNWINQNSIQTLARNFLETSLKLNTATSPGEKLHLILKEHIEFPINISFIASGKAYLIIPTKNKTKNKVIFVSLSQQLIAGWYLTPCEECLFCETPPGKTSLDYLKTGNGQNWNAYIFGQFSRQTCLK